MKINMDSFPEKTDSRNPIKSWLCYISLWRFLTIICSFFVIAVVLVLCKAYIRAVLLWLEDQNSLIVAITICFLYIIVSLPISVGYIVLVVAGGYLFGITNGLLLAIIGANFGLLIAHNIIKLFGHHHTIHRFTENETAKAIMRVISGPLCFKIVFCSRLTPIPFGLQNVIFAVSNSILIILSHSFVSLFYFTAQQRQQQSLPFSLTIGIISSTIRCCLRWFHITFDAGRFGKSQY